MTKKTTPVKYTKSQPASEGADFRSWLTLVPEEKRQAVAAIIKSTPVTDYASVITLSQMMLAELVEGNLTPAISREARHWTELIFTAIATENTALGTPEAAYSDVITALVSVRRESPKLEASYTVVDAAPPLPERIVINED
tara:strand:+ start:4436 stop:4858 length:423 start_codon:yes stop_codon:yes gene_type:complete